MMSCKSDVNTQAFVTGNLLVHFIKFKYWTVYNSNAVLGTLELLYMGTSRLGTRISSIYDTLESVIISRSHELLNLLYSCSCIFNCIVTESYLSLRKVSSWLYKNNKWIDPPPPPLKCKLYFTYHLLYLPYFRLASSSLDRPLHIQTTLRAETYR